MEKQMNQNSSKYVQEIKKLKQSIGLKDSRLGELQRQIECSLMANEENSARHVQRHAAWISERAEL